MEMVLGVFSAMEFAGGSGWGFQGVEVGSRWGAQGVQQVCRERVRRLVRGPCRGSAIE